MFRLEESKTATLPPAGAFCQGRTREPAAEEGRNIREACEPLLPLQRLPELRKSLTTEAKLASQRLNINATCLMRW